MYIFRNIDRERNELFDKFCQIESVKVKENEKSELRKENNKCELPRENEKSDLLKVKCELSKKNDENLSKNRGNI